MEWKMKNLNIFEVQGKIKFLGVGSREKIYRGDCLKRGLWQYTHLMGDLARKSNGGVWWGRVIPQCILWKKKFSSYISFDNAREKGSARKSDWRALPFLFENHSLIGVTVFETSDVKPKWWNSSSFDLKQLSLCNLVTRWG